MECKVTLFWECHLNTTIIYQLWIVSICVNYFFFFIMLNINTRDDDNIAFTRRHRLSEKYITYTFITSDMKIFNYYQYNNVSENMSVLTNRRYYNILPGTQIAWQCKEAYLYYHYPSNYFYLKVTQEINLSNQYNIRIVILNIV